MVGWMARSCCTNGLLNLFYSHFKELKNLAENPVQEPNREFQQHDHQEPAIHSPRYRAVHPAHRQPTACHLRAGFLKQYF
jgi:hypothetical protein